MNIIRLALGSFKETMTELNITDDNVEDTSCYFICINSSGFVHSVPYFKDKHPNVINLNFDDVEKDGPKEIPWFNNTTKIIEAIAMTIEQAKLLAEFIDKIDSDATVYVHCIKGSSRSGAIEDYLNNLSNPSEYSNKHVFNLLREAKNVRF